ARRRDRAHRGADDLPGDDARPDRRGAGALMRALVSSVIAVVALTVVFGLAYPALMTAFAQATFTRQADGSLVKVDGRVVGSSLAAQGFSGPRWFHERPSATSPAYDAGATTFANLGPTSSQLAKNVRAAAEAVLARERPYNPGLTIGRIPV